MLDTSKLLLEMQSNDLTHIKKYYGTWSAPNELLAKHEKLLGMCHRFAFTVAFWNFYLPNTPISALPYFRELKSDAIQLLDSVILGNVKSFHLFLRSCIENFLRYVFYFHHPIEHEILQNEPKKYPSFEDLVKWTKSHPHVKTVQSSLVEASCDLLSSEYADLSQTIHATTLIRLQLVEALTSIHLPFSDVEKETARVELISRSIVFLLSCFHLDDYKALDAAQRTLANHLISEEQVRALNQLK